MGLSGLNSHRQQYQFINDGTCPKCRTKKEDNVHFLSNCPAYAAQRAEMVAHLSQLMSQVQDKFQNPTKRNQKEPTEMLLSGILDEALDIEIFSLVEHYI